MLIEKTFLGFQDCFLGQDFEPFKLSRLKGFLKSAADARSFHLDHVLLPRSVEISRLQRRLISTQMRGVVFAAAQLFLTVDSEAAGVLVINR